MKVEKLTCHIGAELSGVSLAEAAHNADLFGAIRAELLKHKVLFLRDQDIVLPIMLSLPNASGRLEDHPVVGSDPE